MDKSSITKQMLSGNNTLNSIIVRIDFLTIDVKNLVEQLLIKLGEQYTYNQINSYNINLDISDPKKLITQDFINQKVNTNNNYEFKNNNTLSFKNCSDERVIKIFQQVFRYSIISLEYLLSIL